MALLQKIGELKREGYSLPDIKQAMEKDLARTRENEPDLAGLEDARMRSAIVSAASEEFATNGYRGTHVMAIIQKLGINPHIFYRHFPSKLELLARMLQSSYPAAHRRQRGPRGGASRLRRARGARTHRATPIGTGSVRPCGRRSDRRSRWNGRPHSGWQTCGTPSSSTSCAISSEVRQPGSPPAPVREELLAYSLIGAHRAASERASWDDKY